MDRLTERGMDSYGRGLGLLLGFNHIVRCLVLEAVSCSHAVVSKSLAHHMSGFIRLPNVNVTIIPPQR